ncbi:hypothetical protein ACGGZK_08790 [Agromyces sp. MMS24-K17]|uniref:hypothetical protein n=1 Tax=Agromyces sp. MMS24-K17 TaxID=3372850 RepID=UPI0037544E19
MTDPSPAPPATRSTAATIALWLSIGMLVAAALLGGYFIIVGDQANVAGRAWLTLVLVALFAGAVVLDANVSNGPNRWYLAASTIVNVVLVGVGLLKVWNGWGQPADTDDAFVWWGQILRFLMVIALLRLALLVSQLYGLHFIARGRTAATRVAASVTLAFVWLTAIVLAAPAAFPEAAWPDWWWRAAGATSLVAVVTAVIPLVVRAFTPREPRPVAVAAVQQQGYPVPQQGYPQGVQPGYIPQPGYAPQPGYLPQPAYAAPAAPQPPAAPPVAPAQPPTLPPPA